MTAAVAPGPSAITFQSVTIPPPAGIETPPTQLIAYAIDPGKEDVSFYVGPKDFDELRPRRPEPGARHRLRHVRRDRRAAPAFAQVDQRVRRQLRLVDHHPDRADQRDHVPAAAQERGLDAEDAGDPAGGQGDPGPLREAEGDRSREAENEPGAHGPLPRTGRQPRERLHPHAADACRCCLRSIPC